MAHAIGAPAGAYMERRHFGEAANATDIKHIAPDRYRVSSGVRGIIVRTALGKERKETTKKIQ